MPAFTFTADAASDQLTIVGHGLVTGDGPGVVFSGGGTLSGGLAELTDYFAIRVDADHIKVATSNANAVAGTAVNITSNGTGTQYLGIGLPHRVPRILAQFAQVKSIDINSTWQTAVGYKRTAWTRTFTPTFLQNSGFTFTTNPLGGGNGPQAWVFTSVGGVNFVPIDIPFEDGDTLIGFRYWASGDGAADATWSLQYSPDMSTDLTTIAFWQDFNRAAAWTLVNGTALSTSPVFVPRLLTSGCTIRVQMSVNPSAVAQRYAIGQFVPVFARL